MQATRLFHQEMMKVPVQTDKGTPVRGRWKCSLLILDEPSAAMDVESTLLAETLLREYQKQTGCCVILITHSLQQTQRMADDVLFLHAGKLVEQGSAIQVLEAPQTPQAKTFIKFYGR